MKKAAAISFTIFTLVLILSGCGGQNASTGAASSASPGLSSPASATATTQVKAPPSSKSLGKVEVLGEKTKTIGYFEITLEGGDVQPTLNQTKGKKLKPLFDEILVMKAKIKSIRSVEARAANELHYFTVYDAGETQMGDNYIGAHAGNTGEQLEGNLIMKRYLKDEGDEGYIYLDVKKRDAYRIKYEDLTGETGYWDVKITN